MFRKNWKLILLVLIEKFKKFFDELKHGVVQFGQNLLSEASRCSQLHYVWISLCGKLTRSPQNCLNTLMIRL